MFKTRRAQAEREISIVGIPQALHSQTSARSFELAPALIPEQLESHFFLDLCCRKSGLD